MTDVAHVGEMLAIYARLCPEKIGAADLERKMTFRLWHARACRLANAFAGLGLGKGDRVCVLAYNCLEWLEIYAAAAKAGLVVVPINFRLTGPEVRFIVENCEARALIVQDDLLGVIEEIRAELPVPRRELHPFRQRQLARPAIAPTRICSPQRATASPSVADRAAATPGR